TFCAWLIGLGAANYFWGWNSHWQTALGSALCLSIIVNLNFFFIRRWGGCIEKLGGFTFSLYLYLTMLTGLGLLIFSDVITMGALLPYAIFLTIQMIVIGWIATVFLRSKNYTPASSGSCRI
ncbi:MAG TPA: hypothetical protein VJL87_00270, partial [Bdellovibrionota bacterium]|nr:hypothetical protein [Bdellovibrionota bacterium]